MHRSSREFQKGDKVFLRVKPKRSSLKLGKFRKLAHRYCGPFEILQRIGEQSYKLALPEHLHVHNVFHVNLLKKYVPSAEHVLDLDDNVLVNHQEEFQMEPEQILEMKEKQLRNRTVREVLVPSGRVIHWRMLLGRTGVNYLCNFLISKVEILGYLSFGSRILYTWKIIDAICISFGLIEGINKEVFC